MVINPKAKYRLQFAIWSSIFIVFVEFGQLDAVHRKLSYSVNPNCTLDLCNPLRSSKTRLNLVHIQAVGKNDTVHYLWSTYKIPTVIIARTSHSSELSINWEGLLTFQDQSIKFSESPYQSVSFVLKELWEFYDKNDTANMHKSSNITSHGMSGFYWDDINSTLKFTETLITASPQCWSNDDIFANNGTLKVQFSVSAEETPNGDYSHLWFTSNSSQLMLLLTGLNPAFEKSRFAVEVIGISSSNVDTSWLDDNPYVSFDDEYSPGVFKVHRLFSTCSGENNYCKSFVAWKPVAYIGEIATVANSSDATATNYLRSDVNVSNSISASYFNSYANVSQITWKMTFGTSGDGFYSKTLYTSWTVMVGVGDPIMDKMSLLAIIVTAVGLGAPLLIMFGGATFLGYKKCRQKDDELLLEG